MTQDVNMLNVTKTIGKIKIIAKFNFRTVNIINPEKVFKIIEDEFTIGKHLTFFQIARRILNALQFTNNDCYEVELIPPNKGLKDYYEIIVR